MTTDINEKGVEEESGAAKRTKTKTNLSLGVTGGDDLGQPMSVALGAQLGDEGDGVLVMVAVRVVQAGVPLPHHPYVLRVQAELAHTRVVHVLIVHPSATEDSHEAVLPLLPCYR